MEYKNFFNKNLRGTDGLSKLESQVDPNELKAGIEDEKEHTQDERLAKKIALDHLKKDPKYYSKLRKAGLMEDFEKFSVSICSGESQNKGNIAGSIGGTPKLPVSSDNLNHSATDPKQSNHVVGSISSTPNKPKSEGNPVQIISVGVKEIPLKETISKKELKKLVREVLSSLDEMAGFSSVGDGNDPSKDSKMKSGCRWTLGNWKESINPEQQANQSQNQLSSIQSAVKQAHEDKNKGLDVNPGDYFSNLKAQLGIQGTTKEIALQKVFETEWKKLFGQLPQW